MQSLIVLRLMTMLPTIKAGERAIVAGRTGSGKSSLARWLLVRSVGHWVIINPKHTKAFDSLPDSNIVEKMESAAIAKSMQDYRFTIINPPSNQATPEHLDALISWLHDNYKNIGLVVDELYAIHSNGRAGQGLIGWLTRGRELKQSFLGLAQRPSWLSKFLFSEAEYICSMSLSMDDDRKRMYEMTGRLEFRDKLPPYYWLWYDVSEDELRKMGRVPLV